MGQCTSEETAPGLFLVRFQKRSRTTRSTSSYILTLGFEVCFRQMSKELQVKGEKSIKRQCNRSLKNKEEVWAWQKMKILAVNGEAQGLRSMIKLLQHNDLPHIGRSAVTAHMHALSSQQRWRWCVYLNLFRYVKANTFYFGAVTSQASLWTATAWRSLWTMLIVALV